ncbi:MAG: AEC family transporter [Bifidobacteriaceae bacterium]|jgi:predicted permease|nr:AEC family transporter [Bifidobacteriaceae bacterium]
MFAALQGFVTVSVPIVVGYLIARFRVVTPQTAKQLNLLAVNALVPVLLFVIMSEAEPRLLFSSLAMTSFLAAVAVFAAYGLAAGLIWRPGGSALTVGALAAGYTNAGNIGLPIAMHMLGDPALVAPIVLFQTGFFAPIGLAVLAVFAKRRDSGPPAVADKRLAAPVGKAIAGAIFSPIVIGSLTGVAVSATHWTVPLVAMEPIRLIAGGAVPIMLIAFGMSLRETPVLAKTSARGQVALITGMKLLVMPLTAWTLGRFVFGLDPAGVYAVTTMAALPTAQNVFNYSIRYDASPILARDSVTLTTLGAAPMVFVVAALLGTS